MRALSVQCSAPLRSAAQKRSLSLSLFPSSLSVCLDAILVELRARSEGANHNAAGPNRLVEELIETIVRYGNFEFAV